MSGAKGHALAPGAILELPKLADEELEVLVNNKPIGLGTAVKVGENFGIRITYVGDLRHRINALGPIGKTTNLDDTSADAALAALAGSAPLVAQDRRPVQPGPQAVPTSVC